MVLLPAFHVLISPHPKWTTCSFFNITAYSLLSCVHQHEHSQNHIYLVWHVPNSCCAYLLISFMISCAIAVSNMFTTSILDKCWTVSHGYHKMLPLLQIKRWYLVTQTSVTPLWLFIKICCSSLFITTISAVTVAICVCSRSH